MSGNQLGWEAPITASKAIRRHRALLGLAIVVLGLAAAGFWWHPAWGIDALVALAMWLGSGAIPGIR